MPDFSFERALGGPLIAGVDEVGYGAWAGPVVVAAVVFHTYNLPPEIACEIQDSKRLSSEKRETLYSTFTQCAQWGKFAVGIVPVEAIVAGNVLKETLQEMAHVVHQLEPRAILVDGIRALPSPLPQQCVPKGDALSLTIAMASIIAKVTRDRLMDQLALSYPDFKWESNKGYGTVFHQHALRKHGLTPHHRPKYCRRLFE